MVLLRPTASNPIQSHMPTAAPPQHLNLPYVEDKWLPYLQTRSRFVELPKLLPQKRFRLDTSLTKVTVHDNGSTSIASSKQTEVITSATEWCQAFGTFAAYHAYYYPSLAASLFSYLAFMTTKLSAYPLDVCLDYDVGFRKKLCRFPDSVKWECPDQGILDTTFKAPTISISTAPTISIPTVTIPEPPRSNNTPYAKTQRSSKMQTDICLLFNDNRCQGKLCPNHRVHACYVCKREHKCCVAHPQDWQALQLQLFPKNGRRQGAPLPARR